MEPRTNLRLQLRSTAFNNGETIPIRHTCDGEDISPALEIRDVPDQAQSLALIVEDPDAPRGTWTHWLVWNIPPTDYIGEGDIPGIEGTNDFGKLHYGGPCPPGGTHRYFFRLYALDRSLDLLEGSRKNELLEAVEPHVIASGELMGKYSRR